MRYPLNKQYPQTQKFNDPCCRASYLKFGLLGHNGWDIGCPTGTAVLAPHDGIIRETGDEGKNGYGRYIKLENAHEGSVLAHLKEFKVSVGQSVKEGETIGYSDNTGNSTGAHLHWGYYRLPRNRDNGFNGFIDQTDWLNNTPVLNLSEDELKALAVLHNAKTTLKAADKQPFNSLEGMTRDLVDAWPKWRDSQDNYQPPPPPDNSGEEAKGLLSRLASALVELLSWTQQKPK